MNDGRNYTGATQRLVVRLSDKEFEELVEAREQAWDRQIEADAEAGKFDQLAEEALRDYREEKCIRFPCNSVRLSARNFSTRTDICRPA